jgi:hypothetical protein
LHLPGTATRIAARPSSLTSSGGSSASITCIAPAAITTAGTSCVIGNRLLAALHTS